MRETKCLPYLSETKSLLLPLPSLCARGSVGYSVNNAIREKTLFSSRYFIFLLSLNPHTQSSLVLSLTPHTQSSLVQSQIPRASIQDREAGVSTKLLTQYSSSPVSIYRAVAVGCDPATNVLSYGLK